MASATKTVKNFSDTADSFRPSHQFDYLWKKGQCQYKLLLQNQVSQLSEFLQEGVPSKDKIEELIRRFQRQTDAIISQLLTQTTQVRRKMRNQQDYYESVVREQKSKIRKLTQENIELTSHLNTFQKTHSKAVEQLKNGLSNCSDQASRQIQGLQLLLSEYEKALQEKDNQIIELKQQCIRNESLYEECKVQILSQVRQIQQLTQTSQALKQSLRTQQAMLRLDQSKQLSLILDYDQRYQQMLKKKEEEIYILAASEFKQRNQIEDLVIVIEELKKEIQKEQRQRIKSQEKAKINLSKLIQNSQKSIKMIREKYQSKIQKISDLLMKELKKAKKQIEALKAFIPRQIYSCLKEIKGSFFAEVYQYKH